MMIKIAVADCNLEYTERILSVLQRYEDISLSIYTERRTLEQALASKRFDVLLFDPSVYEGQTGLGKCTLAVMLLDEEKGVPESCRELKKIRKYQRISRIYQQILELYAEVCEDIDDVVGQGRAISLAYYSPVGGAGKTALALAAATKLAMQGYKTLYLNLEDIASEDCYLPQNAERGLSEVISLLDRDINLSMKVESLLQNKMEGFYYLNHFDSPNDICEVTGEELEQLIRQFGRMQLFEYIVIDMGVSVNEKTLHVFEAADKIVLVEKADAMAVRKLQCFLEQTHIISEYGRKMVRVLNFDMGRGSGISSDIPLIGKINMVQNPDAAQFVTMLANRGEGNYVLQLLRR